MIQNNTKNIYIYIEREREREGEREREREKAQLLLPFPYGKLTNSFLQLNMICLFCFFPSLSLPSDYFFVLHFKQER